MAPPHPLEAQVARILQSAGLARSRRGALLVAVSGGPDSTALLAALVSLREALGLRLHAVHVDHRLRPDSAADAAYVRRLAHRWSVPVTVRRANVARQRAAGRLSVEEAARQARYAILAQAARETGAAAVLVAHTADDQVETVLLGLLRGAGLRGLAGMEAVTPLPPTPEEPTPPAVPLVRPLLEVSRAEVEAYVESRRLRPRRDSSNLSPAFLRNRIRAELVPLMEELRPGARRALERAAKAAREALAFLEAPATQAWDSGARREGGTLLLGAAAVAGLHPAVRTLLLQRAVREIAGTTEGFTARHWDAMARLLAEARPGAALRLPHDLRLTVLYGEAALTQGDLPCPFPLVQEAALVVPGETAVGGWRLGTTWTPEGGLRLEARARDIVRPTPPLPGPLAVELPMGTGLVLVARPRHAGDRMRLRGGSRKLQDILTDARMPRSWRDRLPVVAEARTGEVLWVVGVTAAAGVRPISPVVAKASRIKA